MNSSRKTASARTMDAQRPMVPTTHLARILRSDGGSPAVRLLTLPLRGLAALIRRVRVTRAKARLWRELSMMSEHQLDDIGITRGDIHLVVEGRFDVAARRGSDAPTLKRMAVAYTKPALDSANDDGRSKVA